MMDSPAGTRTRTSTPIAEYGLIGDTRTAALVGADGAIDWFCVPRFDGQPVFGRLVGGPSAGMFRVGPARPGTLVERRYRRHTATLETTWTVGGSQLTLTEARWSPRSPDGCCPQPCWCGACRPRQDRSTR
jgi:GH15 family glucan-1,4-alpha-glucosidase